MPKDKTEEPNGAPAIDPDPPQTDDGISVPMLTSAVNYPTVYADGCIFASRFGSTVRLTFIETIIEAADAPYPGPKSRHVGTLVMPAEGFRNMLRYLNDVTPKFIFPNEAEDGE